MYEWIKLLLFSLHPYWEKGNFYKIEIWFWLQPTLSFSGKCEYNPIGLEYGIFSVSSSTEQSTYEDFEVHLGGNGWCAQDGDPDRTLTISFGRLIKVCAVETAGVDHHDEPGSYANVILVEFSADVDGNTFSNPEVNVSKSYKSS